jgi:hypothetical protein
LNDRERNRETSGQNDRLNQKFNHRLLYRRFFNHEKSRGGRAGWNQTESSLRQRQIETDRDRGERGERGRETDRQMDRA